jgi:hypothetical protein
VEVKKAGKSDLVETEAKAKPDASPKPSASPAAAAKAAAAPSTGPTSGLRVAGSKVLFEEHKG